MRSFRTAAVTLVSVAGLGVGLGIAAAPAAAAECPSEQSVLPYSKNDPPFQCAQMHNSGKKELKPLQSKTWSKSIAYGYPVEARCRWKSNSAVTVTEAYLTSNYSATGTNWDVFNTRKFSAGVLFTTGSVDAGGYGGCSNQGEVENSIVRVVQSLTLSGVPSTAVVDEPVIITATVSPSSAPGGLALQDADKPKDTPPLAQALLSGGTATFRWVPSEAGTFRVKAGYGGDTSACPSYQSTCGFTPAESKRHTVTVTDPATASAATVRAASSRGPSRIPARAAVARPAQADPPAFSVPVIPRPRGTDFRVLTRERTRTMPARLELRCPRGRTLMHAETLSESGGDVPVAMGRRTARVRPTAAGRGQRVTLQVTCRLDRAPRLVRNRLGFGTAQADRLATAGRRGTLMGGPGRDRLSVRHRDGVAIGGTGNDTVVVAGRDGVANGGPGDDRLTATARSRALLIGGPGRDTLVGSRGATHINALDGEADLIICRSARNRVIADRLDVVRAPCRPVRRG
jgi:hypothetical protein